MQNTSKLFFFFFQTIIKDFATNLSLCRITVLLEDETKKKKEKEKRKKKERKRREKIEKIEEKNSDIAHSTNN